MNKRERDAINSMIAIELMGIFACLFLMSLTLLGAYYVFGN